MVGNANESDEKRLLVEVDGPGISPQNVDLPVFLDLAAAFFQLLNANAEELAAAPLGFTNVEIIDKCIALRADVDNPSVALECAEMALRQIAGEASPRGATSYVERARAARRALPEDCHAKVFVGHSWVRPVEVATDRAAPPLDELLSLRVEPIRAGGKRPAVRFRSLLEEDFTLDATQEQARALGAMLYTEVDISAKVARDSSSRICAGRLETYDPVEDGDPRPAWRDWYEKVRAPVEEEPTGERPDVDSSTERGR